MTEIKLSTKVGFPQGETEGRSTVLYVGREPGRMLLVTDATPVHPVGFRWPDQPSDIATITCEGRTHAMVEALTGLVNAETGELVVGEEAKALGRSASDWIGVVVHLIEEEDNLPAVGDNVEISVDQQRRALLSASHTAAHLVAFALNRALTPFWTKQDAQLDSLSSPDFDKEAIVSSRLSTEGAVDVYRVGKSLRKKGFDHQAVSEQLSSVVDEVNASVAHWLSRPLSPVLVPSDTTLDTRRIWRCEIEGAQAEMFCAGTHVKDISSIKGAHVFILPTEDGFQMETTVRTV